MAIISALALALLAASFASAQTQQRAALRALDEMTALSHQKASLWLRQKLVDALGNEFDQRVHRRLENRERILGPMFDSMPKNKWGCLGPVGSRYALHRYFAHTHGMYVIGLEPTNETMTMSPVKAILGDRVPGTLEAEAEARLNGRGFGLNELAVMALAMEHFIHGLVVERIDVAFKLLGLPTDGGVVTTEKMEEAIDMHNLLFLVGGDPKKVTAQELNLRRGMATADGSLDHWAEFQAASRETMNNLIESGDASVMAPMDFAARVLDDVGDQLAHVQQLGCHDLKHELRKIGNANGRVTLTDFYRGTTDGKWQFTESKTYLRDAGALEETNPKNPKIIIPNYLYGGSNCLTKSGIFTVCCANECNDLLAHIERTVRTPEVAPARLVEILSKLPSSSVAAPREIPSELVVRLDQIAQMHNGKVPIHGRLFSQLLHHAYPLECPYPRFTNSSTAMGDALSSNFIASYQDIQSVMDAATWQAEYAELQRDAGVEPEVFDEEEDLPWLNEEELLAGKHRRSSYKQDAAALAGILVIGAGILSMWNTAQAAFRKVVLLSAKKKYMV